MKNKIKILFILPKAQQGGAETQMLYLLKNINKNKFQVYLGFLYEHDQIKDAFKKLKDIKLIYFKKRGALDISIYFKIATFLKKNKIDVIHTFLGNHHSYIPAFFYRKTLSFGGIMGTHDKDISCIDRFKEFTLGKLFTKLNNYILVSCSYSGKEVSLKKGFSSKSIFVIPNGIDYKKYSDGNKKKIIKEFNFKKKIVLGMVGRLVDTKNHEKLIFAFKDLISLNDNLALLIVGDGPLMNYLKKQAKRLGLSEKVIFTGNRKDVPDLLSAVDIFVFPSLTEGWPNVVGEAMASGLPVVSYPVGDIRYIIKNGYNGIITKPRMNSFKNETIKLIKNETKRKILGKNAKLTIKDNFSVDIMVNRYEEIYFKMLGKKK